MALTEAVLNAGVDGATAIAAWAAIHEADSAGSQVSNERVAVSWDPATGAVAASGDVPLAFTGTADDRTELYLGLWSAESGGTYRGAAELTGDTDFNAAGDYEVTAVTMTGTDQT